MRFFGVPKVANQGVNTISQWLMGIFQLSNHVVQTEEQMTHWDMLNKATKSEFSLFQCVTCSPVWRFFVRDCSAAKGPLDLVAVFAAIRSFDA